MPARNLLHARFLSLVCLVLFTLLWCMIPSMPDSSLAKVELMLATTYAPSARMWREGGRMEAEQGAWPGTLRLRTADAVAADKPGTLPLPTADEVAAANAGAKAISQLLVGLISRSASRRFVVADVRNGLGNRLRVLASAMGVAASEARPLLVVWERNAHCNVSFRQLFSAPCARTRHRHTGTPSAADALAWCLRPSAQIPPYAPTPPPTVCAIPLATA